MVLPVIFPPGWARLATKPALTGSPIPIMTMGRVVVACLAACVAGEPLVTMTSTGEPAPSRPLRAAQAVLPQIDIQWRCPGLRCSQGRAILAERGPTEPRDR